MESILEIGTQWNNHIELYLYNSFIHQNALNINRRYKLYINSLRQPDVTLYCAIFKLLNDTKDKFKFDGNEITEDENYKYVVTGESSQLLSFMVNPRSEDDMYKHLANIECLKFHISPYDDPYDIKTFTPDRIIYSPYYYSQQVIDARGGYVPAVVQMARLKMEREATSCASNRLGVEGGFNQLFRLPDNIVTEAKINPDTGELDFISGDKSTYERMRDVHYLSPVLEVVSEAQLFSDIIGMDAGNSSVVDVTDTVSNVEYNAVDAENGEQVNIQHEVIEATNLPSSSDLDHSSSSSSSDEQTTSPVMLSSPSLFERQLGVDRLVSETLAKVNANRLTQTYVLDSQPPPDYKDAAELFPSQMNEAIGNGVQPFLAAYPETINYHMVAGMKLWYCRNGLSKYGRYTITSRDSLPFSELVTGTNSMIGDIPVKVRETLDLPGGFEPFNVIFYGSFDTYPILSQSM